MGMPMPIPMRTQACEDAGSRSASNPVKENEKSVCDRAKVMADLVTIYLGGIIGMTTRVEH
jgi:hypothetical protein